MNTLSSPTPNEFREKRIEAKLSQSDTAEILSVHTNTVKNWEHGRTKCSPATWAFFCIRLEEREQHLRKIAAEIRRRFKSQVFRNEFVRKMKGETTN